MSNGERETPTNSPSEGERKQERKRTPEDQERKERERKKEAKKEKKERKEEKKEAKISPEEKAAKGLEKLAVSAERLVKGFDELYERTGDLSLAFTQLSTQIKEGTIKDFEQLSKVMDWFEGKLKTAGNRIDRTAKKAEKAAEDSKIAAEAQKENTEAVKQFVSEYEAITKGFRETAEAFVEQGMAGVPPTARPPRYEKGKEDDLIKWFELQLRRVEERDQSFSENWRMIWPMETFLSSIPVVDEEGNVDERAKAFYDKLIQKFEDRRRLHDYNWLYGRAAGTDPILNASSILSTKAVERVLREEEGVAEGMVKFQALAEVVFDNKREVGHWEKMMAEAEIAGDETKKEECKKNKEGLERTQADLKDTMKRLLEGKIDYEVEDKIVIEDESVEEKNKEEFDKTKAINRLAGRLFVVLGFAASYDIDDLASGDFFTARLINLKKWFVGGARKPGDRWYGREKLWRRFDPEFWGTKFAGGFFASIGKDKELEEFGLELDQEKEEGEDGRRLKRYKITDPEKLGGLDLRKLGVVKESQLVDWADSVWKADQMRKVLIGKDEYLDRPTMEKFLKLGETMDHLKGEKKWQLFSLMFHDLADFHTGPGALDRILKLKFWEFYDVTDPKTGEKRKTGISFIRSDAERLGIDKGWSAGEVHNQAKEALKANMVSKPYIEKVLREKLSLVGIPGIGPVRFTKEVLDYIGWGGLLAMILAPIIEFIKNLGKQIEGQKGF